MKRTAILINFLLFNWLSMAQGLVPFSQDDLWGFLDTLGHEKIAPQFQQASYFENNLAPVVQNGLLGFIDETGEMVIPALYSNFTEFSDGYAAVEYEEDWIMIDELGRIANDTYYGYPLLFKNGLAKLSSDSDDAFYVQHGFVNIQGDTIIPMQYAYASNFSDGLCMVAKDSEHYGYINSKGEEVINMKYAIEGMMKINGSYDFKEYDFSEGLVTVREDGVAGVINKKGDLVIDYNFDFIGKFVDGMAPASVDGIYGYIDQKGEWLIKPQFAMAEAFSDGIAVVCIGESSFDCKYTLIDINGNQLFEPFILGTLDYTSPLLFKDGYLPCIVAPRTYGYVNRAGKVLWKMEF